MAADYPISGAQVALAFGWESTFKTLASPVDKGFGQGQKITTYDIDNDVEYVYSLGSQDLSAQFAKKFNGGWGVEFIYSDPWFLRTILGAAPTTTGAGPYTHTWTVANSGITNTLTPMSIVLAAAINGNSDQNLLGCVANTMTLTAAAGEPIKVKLDGFFSQFAKDTVLTTGATLVDDPMTFAQATLEFPSGTAIANVQSCDITFTRNSEGVFGLGARYPNTQLAKAREWSIKVSIAYQNDTDFLDHVLGSTTVPTTIPAELATCVLTITNGGATTSLRSLTLTFANVIVAKTSMPIAVEDMVKMDVELRARSITSVIAINNTSTFK